MVNIELLKELQNQMKYEDEYDNDCQASSRFWVIMDYKEEIGDEEYHLGKYVYFHNDGDFKEFSDLDDLKVFLVDLGYDEEDEYLLELFELESLDFSMLWSYVIDNYEYFESCFIREVEFIVPSTMFLTKKEANRHLELNKHHYTSKAHTYAMTAWRAPQVNEALKLLMNIDLDKLELLK